MGGSSIIMGFAGVRACAIGDGHGRLVDHAGALSDPPAICAAAAGVITALQDVGKLAGLGVPKTVTVRCALATWVVAADARATVAVEMAPTLATAALESALQSMDWPALAEWETVKDSDIESLPGDPSAPDTGEQPTRPTQRRRSEKPEPAKAAHVVLRPIRSAQPAAVAASMAREKSTVPVSPPPASGPSDARSGVGLIAAPPAFAGSLHVLGPSELIQFLRNGRRTGTLTVSSDAGAGRVHMRGGRIVGASAPGAKTLIYYLLAQEPTAPPRLGSLNDIDPGAWSLPTIGATLVKSGVATRAQVRSALGAQIRDALAEMLKWSRGDFSFDSNDALSASAPDEELEFDPQAMLLEVVRNQPSSNPPSDQAGASGRASEGGDRRLARDG